MENEPLAREAENVAIEVIDALVNEILAELQKRNLNKAVVLEKLSLIETWIARFREARK